MTVTSTKRRQAYVGNGSTRSFAVPFQFFELSVYVNGVLQTKGVHYSISQATSGGTGSVTLSAPPATGAIVVVIGDTTPAQNTDFVENSGFPADAAEKAIDRAIMLAVEAALKGEFALRLPPGKGMTAPGELSTDGVPKIVNGAVVMVPASQLIDVPVAAAAASATAAAGSAASAATAAASASATQGLVNSYVQGLTGGVNLDRFETRASAALATIQNTVNWLSTAGRITRGDGGEGVYFRRASAPSPSNAAVHFQSADGAWWELAGKSVNAKQAGAVGDGSTNDATAITNMVTCGRSDIVFPPGTYKVGSDIVATASNLVIRGQGDARIVADQAATIVNLLKIEGDGVTVRDLIFEGQQWSALGDTINLDTCLRFSKSNIALPTDEGRIINVRTFGGKKGVVVNGGRRFDLDGVYIDKPYEYGLVVQYGLQDSTIRGLIIRRVGITDGLKFGFGGSIQDLRNVTVTDFYIEDCGVLDTTRSNWQNGIDVYNATMAGVTFANGHIKDCGGAIEVKTNAQTSVLPDTSDLLKISNVHIESKWGNKYGIFVAWATLSSGQPDPNSTVPDKQGKITISDCTMRTVLGAGEVQDSGNCFVELDGVSNSRVENCHTFGVYRFCRLTGMGSNDAAVRDVTVQGCSARGSGIEGGVVFAGGVAENIRVLNCDFEATRPIQFNGAAGSGQSLDTGDATNVTVRGCRLVTNTTSPNDGCIHIRRIKGVCIIEDNYLEAAYRPLQSVADSGGMTCTGYIRNNHVQPRLTAQVQYAFDLREGTWFIHSNDCSALNSANARTHTSVSPAVVKAWRNFRGTTNNAAPTGGGSLGDFYGNHALGAGGVPEWFCTGASDGAGTWKGAAAIAA